MIDIHETTSALQGSMRLAMGRPEGLAVFRRDMDAFWRSFSAIVIALPVYLAVMWCEYVIIAEANDGQTPDLLRFIIVRLVDYPVDWIAFPLAMIYLSRLLGVTQNFAGYIIVYNWTSVIVVTALALPLVLHAAFAVPQTLVSILYLAMLIAFLRLRWFIARLVLGVSPVTAVGLVVIEFALGLLLSRLFYSLI